MIIQKDLRKLFQQLAHDDIAHISMSGMDITLCIFDKAMKLSLSTPVYLGGNFIPKSVRKCVTQHPLFDQKIIKTSLSIDENNFQIDLKYLGVMEHLNTQSFVDLLEEFSLLATEWKNFLDEHDKNDLVHVRVI